MDQSPHERNHFRLRVPGQFCPDAIPVVAFQAILKVDPVRNPRDLPRRDPQGQQVLLGLRGEGNEFPHREPEAEDLQASQEPGTQPFRVDLVAPRQLVEDPFPEQKPDQAGNQPRG